MPNPTVTPEHLQDAWVDHVIERMDYDPNRACRCCHIERPTVQARKDCEARYGIQDEEPRTHAMFLKPPLAWEYVAPGSTQWEWVDTFNCCPNCYELIRDSAKLTQHLGECLG